MKEVTPIKILDAMAPAHPGNSRYAHRILELFSATNSAEAAGPKGQILLECADTLGAMAVSLGYSAQEPPSLDGRLDRAATHVMGAHPDC